MRKKIVAGNWKMNTTAQEAMELTASIVHRVKNIPQDNVKIILCPPFPYLQEVHRQVKALSSIVVGAQNCSDHLSGAYTGEVSVSMLKSLGISYVILGHSERRKYFGEAGKILANKMDNVLVGGLNPIYCCGEPLEVRKANAEKSFVKTQLEEGLFHLNHETMRRVTIAYEPIWAIGSGATATPQQVQEMHTMIRCHIATKFDHLIANSISLLYGGSVTENSAKALFACADVDGGLVGGASLKAKEFINIIQSI